MLINVVNAMLAWSSAVSGTLELARLTDQPR
jgi:hypothetical protein